MANAALPMPCNAHLTPFCGFRQSLVKGLSVCVFFINPFISPRRAKLGGVTRGMRSTGTSPPTPAAGAPPAGPWQELI